MGGNIKPLDTHYNAMKVIKDLEYAKGTKRYAIFECPHCHRPFETRVDRAKEKRVSSCGCISDKIRVQKLTKHGDCSGGEYSRLRNTWNNMKQRCLNEKYPKFKDYGGRGIAVCEEWKNSYLSFKKWSIENGYVDNLQIDRIDNNKGYSPENCQWISSMENNQSSKKRNRVGKTGIKNVTQHSQNGTYFGQKTVMGIKYMTKQFKTPEEAKKALNLIIEGKEVVL